MKIVVPDLETPKNIFHKLRLICIHLVKAEAKKKFICTNNFGSVYISVLYTFLTGQQVNGKQGKVRQSGVIDSLP